LVGKRAQINAYEFGRLPDLCPGFAPVYMANKRGKARGL
jgi:hypothetical protein